MNVTRNQSRNLPGRPGFQHSIRLVLALLFLQSAFAQTGFSQSTFRPLTSTAAPFDSAAVLDPSRATLGRECKALSGRLVRDGQEVPIGKLKDFVVDLEGGRVLGATLAASGGQVFMPSTSFQMALERQLQIREDRASLASAPRIHNIQALLQGPDAIKASLSYFSSPETIPNASRLRAASTLAGLKLCSDKGEPLGKVLDVFLDLTAGRLIYLIVQPTIGLEPGSRLYLVPPVMVTAQGLNLTLRSGAAHFLAGRYIFREFPTEIVMANVGIAVYEHYGLGKNIAPKL